MPQTHNGTTDNVNVGMTASGAYQFYFDDPMDMFINLDNSSGVVIDGSAKDDKIFLNNSTNVIIAGNAGNDIFAISATAGGLNGNTIHGQTGYNFITTSGSGTDVNLVGSVGISAVVSKSGLSGQSVDVSLDQFGGSALKNGDNRALVALIGTDGAVNLTAAQNATFVGVIGGAGAGYDASGNAITDAALTALMADVTSDSAITGNLAALYAASQHGVAASQAEVNDLNAYVFQQGSSYFTLWSDGVVTTNGTTALFQPTQAAPAAVTYGSVTMFANSASAFNPSGAYAGANVYTDHKGSPDVRMYHGGSSGSSAINLTNMVSGVSVHGDSGPQGTAYFGLGGSGGNNQVSSPVAGAVFDLQNSPALQDVLHGNAGFDVVKIGPNGGDVNLTSGNVVTSTASNSIDAVVGSSTATNGGIAESVELAVNTVRTVKNSANVPSAVFEALLGSSSDNLTLSGPGKWTQVGGTFTPSSAPANASGLVNASQLDALYHGGQYNAENDLTGYLFEKVGGTGHVQEYLTIYTDALLVNGLTPSTTTAAMAHADLHFA